MVSVFSTPMVQPESVPPDDPLSWTYAVAGLSLRTKLEATVAVRGRLSDRRRECSMPLVSLTMPPTS